MQPLTNPARLSWLDLAPMFARVTPLQRLQFIGRLVGETLNAGGLCEGAEEELRDMDRFVQDIITTEAGRIDADDDFANSPEVRRAERRGEELREVAGIK